MGNPIYVDGKWWPSVEHYFQAQKTTNLQVQEHIRNLNSPKDCFLFWRNPNAPQKRNDWDLIKDAVMEKALFAKFIQHPALKSKLKNTGSKILIEDSPVDSYWGCGANGQGKNMLGVLLMKIRSFI
jgi:ribA/ribD-fused uncharacterized protein